MSCHFLLQGNLPDPVIKLASPALPGGLLPLSHQTTLTLDHALSLKYITCDSVLSETSQLPVMSLYAKFMYRWIYVLFREELQFLYETVTASTFHLLH